MGNWYKWVDVDFCKEPISTLRTQDRESQVPVPPTKATATRSRCDKIDSKLRAVLHEHDARLCRTQAGLDRTKGKKLKRVLSPKVPNVLKFQEIYKRHKAQLSRRLRQQQRKQWEFHFKPVPNFSRLHKRLEKSRSSNSGNSITVPITPQTLVKSIESSKKLELMRRDNEREMMRRPKIIFNSTAYMRREPFLPKYESTIIEPKPFQLRCGERAEIRKQFNARAKHDLEMRLRLEALELARQNHEEYLQLRKLTEFKARPNPWKRISAM
ncbi:uncharacterized protein LOC115631452 [Scaptodrosophila lebanonensis]|uniref:Uncharacterized protein LOC115631452 n=1 Tax=Drosophila lebanonensis TaxID=7225 RepID=A0A6J2U939_DROLE|nr:uncharacterized protein LOC115631452 [Scaptodrosophila lebanonensis]